MKNSWRYSNKKWKDNNLYKSNLSWKNKTKKPKWYYIFGYLVTVIISPILGFISIYYLSHVTAKFKFGDYVGAMKASRNAKFFSVYIILIAIFFSLTYSLILGEAFEAMNNRYYAAKN